MDNSEKISACLRCVIVCEQCITDCILDRKFSCIPICRDCVDICILAARYGARDSRYAKELFDLCTKICKDYAEECSKHEAHHETCKECAIVCQICVDMCKQL